jgi:hypothetical protein
MATTRATPYGDDEGRPVDDEGSEDDDEGEDEGERRGRRGR